MPTPTNATPLLLVVRYRYIPWNTPHTLHWFSLSPESLLLERESRSSASRPQRVDGMAPARGTNNGIKYIVQRRESGVSPQVPWTRNLGRKRDTSPMCLHNSSAFKQRRWKHSTTCLSQIKHILLCSNGVDNTAMPFKVDYENNLTNGLILFIKIIYGGFGDPSLAYSSLAYSATQLVRGWLIFCIRGDTSSGVGYSQSFQV